MKLKFLNIAKINFGDLDIRKEKRIKSGIMASDFLATKHVVSQNKTDDHGNQLNDEYQITGTINKDTRNNKYIEGCIVKKTTISVKEVDTKNDSEDIRYDRTDGKLFFIIDLEKNLVLYPTLDNFGTAQFNKAMSSILKGNLITLNEEEFGDVEISIENIFFNKTFEEFISTLKALGAIKSLEIRYKIPKSQEIKCSDVFGVEKHEKLVVFEESKPTGLDISTGEIENEIKKALEFEKSIIDFNKNNENKYSGKILFVAVSSSGQKLGNNSPLRYQRSEAKLNSRVSFVAESKDIIETFF